MEHFEATVLVHLDAAYNLARWLIDDETAAEDAVQDACVRALRFFGTLSGPSPKRGSWRWCATPASTCCASASTAGSTGGAALF